MRRLPVTFLSLVSILFFTSPVFSQDSVFSFKRAYEDYVYNYTLYKQAEADYQLARGQYMSFKTLNSRRNAQEATAKLLILRDEAVKTYLTAVRMKLRETRGVIDDSTYYGLIDPEVMWFIDHRGKISSSDSLEELVARSDEAKDHFGITEVATYQTLSGIAIGKLNNFRQQLFQIAQSLRSKVDSIKQVQDSEKRLSDKKIQTIERWLSDVEMRLGRSREKEFEAQTILSEQLQPAYDADNAEVYNSRVLSLLSESLQNLREASLFLREIVREIKSRD